MQSFRFPQYKTHNVNRVLKQRNKKCVVTVVIIEKTEAALLILGAQIIFNVMMCNISD
jgi:hypothetical protein